MRKTLEALRASCRAPARDRRNELRILLWMAVWVGTWLLLHWALKNERLEAGTLAFGAITVTVLLGLGTIRAYQRFLREADELRRKVELDGLALGFGAGTIAAFTFVLLESSGVALDLRIVEVVAVMFFAYSVGVVLGLRRYQ